MKLIRPEGEIDFVAATNLIEEPFDVWTIMRRRVRVETAAEIVAKNLWYRGDTLAARDLTQANRPPRKPGWFSSTCRL